MRSDVDSALYLPLRSNADWFSSSTREALEHRIKNALVLYDRLILQDARYIVMVLEEGMVDLEVDPAAIPGDRAEITFFGPGGEGVVRTGPAGSAPSQVLFEGPAIATKEVDFYPIMHDAGLLGADFLQWDRHVLLEDAKQEVQKRKRADLKAAGIQDALPTNRFARTQIVSSLHYDSLLAGLLGWPFLSGPSIGKFLMHKNGVIAEGIVRPEARWLVAESLVTFRLPDFGSLSWDEVVGVREGAAGKELRTKVASMAAEVEEGLPDFEDRVDVERIVARHLVPELLDEVSGRRTGLGEVTFNAVLNLVPYGGVAGLVLDLFNHIRERRSWVSLFRR